MAPKRDRVSSPDSDVNTQAEEGDEEEVKQLHIRMLISELLTHKEKLTDGLLELLTEKGNDNDGKEDSCFGFYDGVSEDQKQMLMETARAQLTALSPVICNKLLPLVIKQLFEEHEKRVAASFGRIIVARTPTSDMAKMYRAAFSQWTDSPFVSYVAGNTDLLGKLTAKECFVLHVYSFMGCFRSKSDNCYAVGITGETSVGIAETVCGKK